jgi:hypothetical protein
MASAQSKRQHWFCEDCGARGYVDHDEHAGVFEVFNAIIESHLATRAEPCPSDYAVRPRIRVQNEAWVDA